MLVLIVIAPSLKVSSQYCGAILTDAEYEKLSERATGAKLSGSDVAAFDVKISIPTQIHIVRRNDGTGGISIEEVNAAFEIVNKRFADANMQFDQCASVNYIDNGTYYSYLSASTEEEEEMEKTYSIDNVINIYFLPNPHSGGSAVCGYAYYPENQKQLVVMNNSCVYGGSTLAHELGHYFNLIHTHGRYNNYLTGELVDGSNCHSEGDFVCDTPADPQLIRYDATLGKFTYAVDGECNYTGSMKDANDEYYEPDTGNLMSYTLNSCKNHFTQGQIERMQHAYLHYRNYLKCDNTESDNNEPDNNEPEVVTPCDVIKNGSFTDGDDSWLRYVNSNANASDYLGYGNAYFYNIDGGTEAWYIQLYQGNLELDGDSRYILSFDSKATNNREITVDINDANDANTSSNILVDETIKLTTEWERRYIVFETKETFGNTRLAFNLGKSNESVFIDNVKIEKETCGKYCNYINNSNFDTEPTDYNAFISSDTDAEVHYNSNEGNMYTDYSISNPGESVWHIQHIQDEFLIEAGKHYTISYKAKSDRKRSIDIDIRNTDDSLSGYFYHTQNIDDSWRTYNHTFYSDVDAYDVELAFNLGKYTGNVALDDIMVIESDCSTSPNNSIGINSNDNNNANSHRPGTALGNSESINAIAYPNPFSDHINISSNSFTEESTIQIYNIQGKLVSEGQYNFNDSANQVLTTSDLQNGIYIVRMQASDKKTQTFKMIKE